MKFTKCLAYFLFCILLLCAVSCATKTIEVEVPVPMQIDLTAEIEPVLLQRPNNAEIKVNAGPVLTLLEMVENDAAYLKAWELWENYANALEETLAVVVDKVNSAGK